MVSIHKDKEILKKKVKLIPIQGCIITFSMLWEKSLFDQPKT